MITKLINVEDFNIAMWHYCKMKLGKKAKDHYTALSIIIIAKNIIEKE